MIKQIKHNWYVRLSIGHLGWMRNTIFFSYKIIPYPSMSRVFYTQRLIRTSVHIHSRNISFDEYRIDKLMSRWFDRSKNVRDITLILIFIIWLFGLSFNYQNSKYWSNVVPRKRCSRAIWVIRQPCPPVLLGMSMPVRSLGPRNVIMLAKIHVAV